MSRRSVLLLPICLLVVFIVTKQNVDQSAEEVRSDTQDPVTVTNSSQTIPVGRIPGNRIKNKGRLLSGRLNTGSPGENNPGDQTKRGLVSLSADIVSDLDRLEQEVGFAERVQKQSDFSPYSISEVGSIDSRSSRVTRCWGPEAPLEKVIAAHNAEIHQRGTRSVGAGTGFEIQANQFFGIRWNRTATDGSFNHRDGLPITLTWSIVPDGTSTPDGEDGSPLPSDFRAWMEGLYGGTVDGPAADQPWFPLIKDAFDSMAATSGLSIQYEPNDDGVMIEESARGVLGVRGDLRLSARFVDGPGDTLAFAYFPPYGDIVLDSGDDSFNNLSSNSVNLFNTLAHEIGHTLGLEHVCPIRRTKLMEPRISEQFRGPRFDEFQSLQRLFGDPLERNGTDRDNDNPERASDLSLTVESPVDLTRLSIDDNTDRDYFLVRAVRGQKLNVVVTPGEGSYSEGGQFGNSCGFGSIFDSRIVHDLSLEIYDESGTNSLIQMNASPSGTAEELSEFVFPEDGDYYLKVSGDTTNAAQIYRLQMSLVEREPAVRIVFGELSISEESGFPANNFVDPRETVRLLLPVTNEGEKPTVGLSVAASSTSGVTIFSASPVFDSLAPEASGEIEIILASTGDCGEKFDLEINLLDDSGESFSVTKSLIVGEAMETNLIAENFDGGSGLPVGWSTSTAGNGVDWGTSSTKFVSPIRSAFSPGVRSASQSILTSPVVTLAEGITTISFENRHEIENSYDGAVLEASRNGGPWFDLPEGGATVLSNGYNRNIREDFGSPIAGRSAWSGISNGFNRSVFALPAAWEGDTLQFRWLLAHDASDSLAGWWIDDIDVTSSLLRCEPHRPFISIVSEATQLDEGSPDQTVTVMLKSELPLLDDLSVTLSSSGSASNDDFSGNLSITLPSGQTEIPIEFEVISDELEEETEFLNLALPTNSLDFAADANEISISILDSAIEENFAGWLATYFDEAIDPRGDSDGDELSEIAEYLLGTDPTDPSSAYTFTLNQVDGDFFLPLPELPDRPDTEIEIEISTDLKTWLPSGIELTSGGVSLPSTQPVQFYRLVFPIPGE